MNDKFFDLKKEKQDRIINAALKIFGSNAYRHASTDEMIKVAGISKGLLFHYFTNKAGLYSFLYLYSMKYVSIELYQCVSIKENDYFELQKQIAYAHYQTMQKYPCMPAFLDRAEYESDPEIAESIQAKRKERRAEYQRILAQAEDFTGKEAVTKEAILCILHYTLKGIKEAFAQRDDADAKELYEQSAAYIDRIKTMVQNVS